MRKHKVNFFGSTSLVTISKLHQDFVVPMPSMGGRLPSGRRGGKRVRTWLQKMKKFFKTTLRKVRNVRKLRNLSQRLLSQMKLRLGFTLTLSRGLSPREGFILKGFTLKGTPNRRVRIDLQYFLTIPFRMNPYGSQCFYDLSIQDKSTGRLESRLSPSNPLRNHKNRKTFPEQASDEIRLSKRRWSRSAKRKEKRSFGRIPFWLWKKLRTKERKKLNIQ